MICKAERRGQAYRFKLRLTKRVKRGLERAMRDDDWHDAGAGWHGKHGEIRLMGWSRQRRVVLRSLSSGRPKAGPVGRRLAGVMITQPQADGQLALGFVEIDEARQEAWEYAVLVTSLEAEVVTIGQLYRDRGDCENSFDKLKNPWGWGGLTTTPHLVANTAAFEDLQINPAARLLLAAIHHYPVLRTRSPTEYGKSIKIPRFLQIRLLPCGLWPQSAQPLTRSSRKPR